MIINNYTLKALCGFNTDLITSKLLESKITKLYEKFEDSFDVPIFENTISSLKRNSSK